MVTTRLESEHLIISNKNRCVELLGNASLDENQTIDLYVSLHLVLEVGLNTLFRHYTLNHLVKAVNKIEVMKNLDKINFTDKTILFIYNAKFNFDDVGVASKYHNTIIGKLRSFSGIRNSLLHGHSISTVVEGDGQAQLSPARAQLEHDSVVKQLRDFRDIMLGLQYFIDRLESSWSDGMKTDMKTGYLDYGFIPKNWLDESVG